MSCLLLRTTFVRVHVIELTFKVLISCCVINIKAVLWPNRFLGDSVLAIGTNCGTTKAGGSLEAASALRHSGPQGRLHQLLAALPNPEQLWRPSFLWVFMLSQIVTIQHGAFLLDFHAVPPHRPLASLTSIPCMFGLSWFLTHWVRSWASHIGSSMAVPIEDWRHKSLQLSRRNCWIPFPKRHSGLSL